MLLLLLLLFLLLPLSLPPPICSQHCTCHCSRSHCRCHGCWCWCQCCWGCTYMHAHCSFCVSVHSFTFVGAWANLCPPHSICLVIHAHLCMFVHVVVTLAFLLSLSSWAVPWYLYQKHVSVHYVFMLLTFKTSTIHLNMKN